MRKKKKLHPQPDLLQQGRREEELHHRLNLLQQDLQEEELHHHHLNLITFQVFKLLFKQLSEAMQGSQPRVLRLQEQLTRLLLMPLLMPFYHLLYHLYSPESSVVVLRAKNSIIRHPFRHQLLQRILRHPEAFAEQEPLMSIL